jgi:DNA invertase Pin-like site-specific DNA recombinase
MSQVLVAYACCSTDQQDLTAQRDALVAMGVDPERIYVDHGLSGKNRDRPGLRTALAACRRGDMLVVTKLDRLARSVLDADHEKSPLSIIKIPQVLAGLG